MTEDTKKQPAIDINKVKKKLQQQKAEIARLEGETESLRNALHKSITDVAERESQETRHDNESEGTHTQPALDESDTVKAFYKRDYSHLLLMLFEKPSKQIRNTAIVALLISIITSITAGYFSAGYLSYTHNIAVNNKIVSLEEKIDLSLQLQKKMAEPNINSIQAKHTDNIEKDVAALTNEPQTKKNTVKKPANTLPVQKTKKSTTEELISQQTSSILQHVKKIERQMGFLDDYTNDKIQLAQLYLTVMPYASTDNIYYESYLNVFKALGVSEDIAPKTPGDLLKIDMDFLHANYSGWVITTKKKANGWRYREEDKRFSSFYNSDLDYDMGDWKIISSAKNYKKTPDIFVFNMERVIQQMTFNRKAAVTLPEHIYYQAYPEESKNKSIENLFDQKNLPRLKGKLKIRASDLDIPSSRIVRNGLTAN